MSEATNQTIESYVNLYTKFFQELTQEYGFSFSISEALNGIQHISDPLDVEDVLYTMQGALCHTKEECDTFEAVFCRRFLQYSYAPKPKESSIPKKRATNVVATNRHKATKQTTDSLEEFRQNHPDDVCKLKVKEHHPTYRNMNRNYPGSVFLIGKQVHVMQGIAGSKDGEATTYKDTNANSIAAGKCKFVAKNSGILFV